ncbi:MAG: hypothetical protein ACYTKD_09880 [Planctomycetota bacterium]|jgi:hypothetical protein
MSETDVPVIGAATPPPAAVVVAVGARFAAAVRSARRRQLVGRAAILVAIVGAGVAAIALAGPAGAARQATVLVGLAAGVSLFVGALVRPRPLELGAGPLARGGGGRVSPVACARAVLVLLPTVVRELLEGLLYGAGLIRHDPAAELAAWILLALAPPHGPGVGTWVSLEGVSAAGLHSLPEDLRAAVRALAARGWVTADRKRYPPLVRLEAEGLEFARTLGSGVG